ncbi:methionine--tRNA ligase MSM1 KNAG_0E03660 [Huiozyma naganishii CBS 8797]|uniref:Methionine--tRNA ligase, mitochondrial n=1 Tax=Huiozyma naganishii (strain ATCC MYA-139 / BCRC 22969 / CBS 8797 / KCTC 17520 / NBRC 10181 / NCYC 3082 / Yp74L-3) TaxID=1071383 RepID=J7RM56_HUIN7|nr:hypothetical protein KNAG_0E03660 [Kazachstania naganishii CBS 8797]CCK70623.1 hypothetical protein KNAG_0E03660 [Kazachstania naganishii CBS 8797]
MRLTHVTTPIFYPNARPHLGHLYSSLLADVHCRWTNLVRPQPMATADPAEKFTTGTDEHGLKIQQASEAQGAGGTPRQFVDRLHREFVRLDSLYSIRYSKFIRTTDPLHMDNVRELWNKCAAKGFIYRGQHSGWYSVSDETFYPESKVVPNEQGTGYINTETNNAVVHHSETNYFFKLSSFRDRLIGLLSQRDPPFVEPEAKREQLLSELLATDPLPDLSVSRPSSRLSWAIRVPGDDSQSVYVWFDALANYISALGPLGTATSGPYWPNTTHILGKDIIKFHAWYWPAFLMAAGEPLPRRLVVHGHWISEGVKMSKSLGNVVDPVTIARKYGTDIVRWYLLENSQIESDNDFNGDAVAKLRELFVDKWGNLINRCSSRKFNIQRARTVFGGHPTAGAFLQEWDEVWRGQFTDQAAQLLVKLQQLTQTIDGRIDSFQYSGILRDAWTVINDANRIVQDTEPWRVDRERQDAVVFLAMEVARILSILLQPFIPRLSGKLLDRLDVSAANRTLEFTQLGTDHTYGTHANDQGRSVPIQREVSEDEYTPDQ